MKILLFFLVVALTNAITINQEECAKNNLSSNSLDVLLNVSFT